MGDVSAEKRGPKEVRGRDLSTPDFASTLTLTMEKTAKSLMLLMVFRTPQQAPGMYPKKPVAKQSAQLTRSEMQITTGADCFPPCVAKMRIKLPTLFDGTRQRW